VESRIKKKLDAYPSSITLGPICRAVLTAEGLTPSPARGMEPLDASLPAT
jgi:hypothetical protein